MMFFAPEAIFGGTTQGATVMSFIGINPSNVNTTGTIGTSGVLGTFQDPNINNETSNATRQLLSYSGNQGGNIFANFIDVVNNAMGWIALFAKVLFSPLFILSTPTFSDAPLPIFFIFGVIPVVLFLVALIMFVRGVIEF